MTDIKISHRTEGEELLILLELMRFKTKYEIGNDELISLVNTITKPITEKEKKLLDEAYNKTFK